MQKCQFCEIPFGPTDDVFGLEPKLSLGVEPAIVDLVVVAFGEEDCVIASG